MDWFKSKFKHSDNQNAQQKSLPFDPQLETEDHYRQRWRSIRVIYYTMFLMSLGFSIILTGIWPYLDKMDPTAGKEFMGYIVAANPLGQMIFSPLVGWWGNRLGTVRLPLLTTLCLFTIASGMYSSIELFPANHKWWMFTSRFLIGVSSANIAVARSYLSAATTIKERTGAVSMVSLAQVLGFIVGPALQAAVTPLGNHGYAIFNGSLHLDMYTASGWINVIMGILNFCMFLPFFFKERRIAAKEVMIAQGKTSEKETWKAIKPDYVSAWTLIGAFFVLVFNFVLLETLGTPLIMDQFAWTKEQALYYMGILMAVGAIVACASFVSIKPLCERFEERKVLIWGGFFFMVLGRFVYIPWGDGPPQMYTPQELLPDQINEVEQLGCPSTQEWCATTNALTVSQFLIGYGLTSIGYPIGVTLIQTIFSKILGPRPQGVWMGLMTGSGCFSRFLGPVFVSFVYTRYGTVWTFAITGTMMALCMLWLWIVRDKLVPPNFELKPDVEMQVIPKDAKHEELIDEKQKLTQNVDNS